MISEKKQPVPPVTAIALLVIWSLTFLVTQLVIWTSARIADLSVTWLEAAGLSLMWNFLRVWYQALAAGAASLEKVIFFTGSLPPIAFRHRQH